MLELLGLEKLYDGVKAISDFSLTVKKDEYITILGPSASGKTTLLRLIAGLEPLDKGKIILDGEDISLKPTHQRTLGFVQQKYALFPHLTVRENVAFGLQNHFSNPVTDEKEISNRCDDILEVVGLADLGNRKIGEISGGQKQRVSLARTLVTRPRFCLLDEPLGALDANLRQRMTSELREIRASLGVSFIHVTGNETEAFSMGDKVIILDSGRLVQIDTPSNILSMPSTVEAARNVNNYNILEGTSTGDKFTTNGQDIPLPLGIKNVLYYAIGYDRITIGDADTSIPSHMGGIKAKYIASRFTGASVVYLFEFGDNKIIEVERHISRDKPREYQAGQMKTLSWNIDQILSYTKDRDLIHSSVNERVAL
ncbi:MAG: ABC transporter ATP-binding protein [Rhizobiales bacterium]|nr:ABC transporter ATP-binding protein [Hyphomicrobiales bacterium]